MLTVLVLYGALVVVFANAASFAMAVPVMVLASFCASLSMSLDSTLLQMQLPDAMRGRVTGIQQLTYALFPLGALPMGALADVIGAPLTVTIGALLCSLMTLLLAVFSPVLWRLRAPERA